MVWNEFQGHQHSRLRSEVIEQHSIHIHSLSSVASEMALCPHYGLQRGNAYGECSTLPSACRSSCRDLISSNHATMILKQSFLSLSAKSLHLILSTLGRNLVPQSSSEAYVGEGTLCFVPDTTPWLPSSDRKAAIAPGRPVNDPV